MMNYWVLGLILGICAVIVAVYLFKRVQSKHAPITEENEIILSDTPDGTIVKKGNVGKNDPEND